MDSKQLTCTCFLSPFPGEGVSRNNNKNRFIGDIVVVYACMYSLFEQGFNLHTVLFNNSCYFMH